MKRWIIGFSVLASVLTCYGQSQDMQQLMLNIEKLAQMKAMLKTMYEGYASLKQGYEQVSAVAKGNFDLHKTFLDGMLDISPTVRQYHKVSVIMQRQTGIAQEYKVAVYQIQSAGMLNAAEMTTLKQSLAVFVNESVRLLEDLLLIITPGKMRMNDEERLRSIDNIDVAMSGLSEKLRAQIADSRKFSDSRARQRKDVNMVKKLYGIKQ
jgi:hypothetical protein